MKTIKKLDAFLKDESGIAWMFAVLLVPLFVAFGALAMDGSNVYAKSRGLQNTADSMALWAVSPTNYQALAAGTPSTTALTNYLSSVGSSNGGVQSLSLQSWSAGLYDVSKTATTGIIPLASGCPTGSTCASAVQVTVCANISTALGGLVGKPTFSVCKTATAITGITSSVSPGNLCPIAISQCMYEDGTWDWTTNPASPSWRHNSDHFFTTKTFSPNTSNDFKWGEGHGDEGSGSSDRDSCGNNYQYCKSTSWFTSFKSSTPRANNWSSDSNGLDANNKNAATCNAGDSINLVTTPPTASYDSTKKYYNGNQDGKWFNNVSAGTSCWVPIVDTKSDTDSNRHVVAFANWDVTSVCSAQKSISIDGNTGHYKDTDDCDYGAATVLYSTNGFVSGSTLTVVGNTFNFSVNQLIVGPGISTGTTIQSLGSCSYGFCTYGISPSQTASFGAVASYKTSDNIYPYLKGRFHNGSSQAPGGSWSTPWALNYSGATLPVLVPNDR